MHDDENIDAEFCARLAATANLATRLMSADQVATVLLTVATNFALQHNAPADVADLLHGAADEILFKLREQPIRPN
jgi:hypothetical protein